MKNLLPFLLLFILGCGDTSQRNVAMVANSTPAITPTVPAEKITAETLAKAAEILSERTEHYAGLFEQGREILGTKPYANAYEGLAALDDPNSRAAKI